MDVNLSKENNNTADVCGEVKYFKYVKKFILGLPGWYKPNFICNCLSFIKFAV